MNEENVMTTNEQEERMPFFRIPKAILTDEKYASLSEGAMLLYDMKSSKTAVIRIKSS